MKFKNGIKAALAIACILTLQTTIASNGYSPHPSPSPCKSELYNDCASYSYGNKPFCVAIEKSTGKPARVDSGMQLGINMPGGPPGSWKVQYCKKYIETGNVFTKGNPKIIAGGCKCRK